MYEAVKDFSHEAYCKELKLPAFYYRTKNKFNTDSLAFRSGHETEFLQNNMQLCFAFFNAKTLKNVVFKIVLSSCLTVSYLNAL